MMANIFNTTTKCMYLHLPRCFKFATLKRYCILSCKDITDLPINQLLHFRKKNMELEQANKKIKREKPNKKWTEEEIKIILNYLQEAPEIEAPTAQIFYKKLVAVCGIDAPWDLIRYKVRHLKASFKKASDWRKSTGAGLLESDAGTSSVEGKVLQMCPHYHQLQEIYGEKMSARADYEVVDTGNSTMDESMHSFTLCSEAATEAAETYVERSNVEICNFAENLNCEEVCSGQSSATISFTHTPTGSTRAQSSSASVSKKAKDFAEKLKKSGPKSSAAYLAAFQADRTAMFNNKFDWEKEKYEKELILNERKIKVKEEKLKSDIEIRNKELDLKILEIEKDERLKIREMEKEERLKKFELELKYKYSAK